MTVSLDDVVVLLGRDFTGDEEDRAARLVTIAEGLVEAELPGFSFAAGTETVTVRWHDPDVIWTPRYPVTAVDGLTVAGSPVDLTSVRWDEKGRVELPGVEPPGWVVNGPAVGAPWPAVTVTYDYGLEVPPVELVGVVAAMVAGVVRRQATNPDNVLSETIGAYQVSYGASQQDAAAKMTVPPLPARWRRTVAVSVPMVRTR